MDKTYRDKDVVKYGDDRKVEKKLAVLHSMSGPDNSVKLLGLGSRKHFVTPGMGVVFEIKHSDLAKITAYLKRDLDPLGLFQP